MATPVSSVITAARQKAQTDFNGISDVNGLAWANDGLLDATRDLIARGIDAAQTQESYATVSASDTQPGRFAWPSDMFALKTIEVDYTNTGGQNYIQAEKLDVSNLQGRTSWDFLRVNQAVASPQFTNHGDTGEIFPTPTGSALVRIYYYLSPTPYTAVTDNVGYPLTLDFDVITNQILISYYQSLEKFDVAAQWKTEYKEKVADFINILGPQSKQPIQPQKLRMTGWNF